MALPRNKEENIVNLGMLSHTSTIFFCCKCEKNRVIEGDENEAVEAIYNLGWRATENNIYCDSCVKKYIIKW